MKLHHMTRNPSNGCPVYWSRDTDRDSAFKIKNIHTKFPVFVSSVNSAVNYAKTFICNNIVYKICNIKQIIFNKYATNLKTTISQRSLRNSGQLLSLFELNNFSFLIDIIDDIIYASRTCDQNSNQWQCSIIVNISVCIT